MRGIFKFIIAFFFISQSFAQEADVKEISDDDVKFAQSTLEYLADRYANSRNRSQGWVKDLKAIEPEASKAKRDIESLGHEWKQSIEELKKESPQEPERVQSPRSIKRKAAIDELEERYDAARSVNPELKARLYRLKRDENAKSIEVEIPNSENPFCQIRGECPADRAREIDVFNLTDPSLIPTENDILIQKQHFIEDAQYEIDRKRALNSVLDLLENGVEAGQPLELDELQLEALRITLLYKRIYGDEGNLATTDAEDEKQRREELEEQLEEQRYEAALAAYFHAKEEHGERIVATNSFYTQRLSTLTSDQSEVQFKAMQCQTMAAYCASMLSADNSNFLSFFELEELIPLYRKIKASDRTSPHRVSENEPERKEEAEEKNEEKSEKEESKKEPTFKPESVSKTFESILFQFYGDLKNAQTMAKAMEKAFKEKIKVLDEEKRERAKQASKDHKPVSKEEEALDKKKRDPNYWFKPYDSYLMYAFPNLYNYWFSHVQPKEGGTMIDFLLKLEKEKKFEALIRSIEKIAEEETGKKIEHTPMPDYYVQFLVGNSPYQIQNYEQNENDEEKNEENGQNSDQNPQNNLLTSIMTFEPTEIDPTELAQKAAQNLHDTIVSMQNLLKDSSGPIIQVEFNGFNGYGMMSSSGFHRDLKTIRGQK